MSASLPLENENNFHLDRFHLHFGADLALILCRLGRLYDLVLIDEIFRFGYFVLLALSDARQMVFCLGLMKQDGRRFMISHSAADGDLYLELKELLEKFADERLN